MPDSNGTHKSKERLQQQVEAKRDEIVNTVDEIRLTLTEEMRERKQEMRERMDWRYYVRHNPAICVGGAALVGLVVGKMVTDRIVDGFRREEPPHWDDRMKERAREYAHRTSQKLDEWSGRAQGEPRWKARSRSMMAGSGNLIMREAMKAAQRMIMPAILAAVTGKMTAKNEAQAEMEKSGMKTPDNAGPRPGPGPMPHPDSYYDNNPL